MPVIVAAAVTARADTARITSNVRRRDRGRSARVIGFDSCSTWLVPPRRPIPVARSLQTPQKRDSRPHGFARGSRGYSRCRQVRRQTNPAATDIGGNGVLWLVVLI